MGDQSVSDAYQYNQGSGEIGGSSVLFSSNKVTDIPLTSNIDIRISVKLNGDSGWTANEPVDVDISCDICYIMATESKTVIGSNGFYSMFDGNNAFAVINSSTEQSVFVKGLPTIAPKSKGQLWQDSNRFIRTT